MNRDASLPVLGREPIRVFLHANRNVLTKFQTSVIEMVLGGAHYEDAILNINREVDLLEKSGWRPKKASGDMVTTPEHYDRYPIEPTFFIVSTGMDWLRGNFLKYVCRFPYKHGVEDLRKSARCLVMLIRFLDRERGWSV